MNVLYRTGKIFTLLLLTVREVIYPRNDKVLFWAENYFKNGFSRLCLLCSFRVLGTVNSRWLLQVPGSPCAPSRLRAVRGSGRGVAPFRLQGLLSKRWVPAPRSVWVRHLAPPGAHHSICLKKLKAGTIKHLLCSGSHLMLICTCKYLNAFEKGTSSAFWWTAQCEDTSPLPGTSWCLLFTIASNREQSPHGWAAQSLPVWVHADQNSSNSRLGRKLQDRRFLVPFAERSVLKKCLPLGWGRARLCRCASRKQMSPSSVVTQGDLLTGGPRRGERTYGVIKNTGFITTVVHLMCHLSVLLIANVSFWDTFMTSCHWFVFNLNGEL